MTRKKWLPVVAVAVVFSAMGVLAVGSASAIEPVFPRIPQEERFHNYYVPQYCAPGHPAQLYVSPRPVPPMMGHTYITYEPLMPHEFLYRHHRTYYRSHGGGSWTRTKVWWW